MEKYEVHSAINHIKTNVETLRSMLTDEPPSPIEQIQAQFVQIREQLKALQANY